MKHSSVPTETIGRFEILKELGSGAFGNVYLAKDPQLERRVALKVPKFSVSVASKALARFLVEAKAAASLHHPNIVAVHDAGQIGNNYYIASAYIDGCSLREMLERSGQPSFAAAVRLVARLADALAYAHQQGVIHRDVKPENVLLDQHGTPYLVDFGLARRQHSDVLQTQVGTVLGTPAYMSPEQAAGENERINGQSDQWSLGVILYELLTGTRPFQGDQMQIMYAIQHTEPDPPAKGNPAVPRDLNTICMRCLSKDPAHRFPDCSALAKDLENWLDDLPIASRRTSIIEKWQRWSRRNPALATLSALLLLVTAGFLIGITLQWSAQVALSRELQLEVQAKEKARKDLSQTLQELTKKNEALETTNNQLRAARTDNAQKSAIVEKQGDTIRQTEQSRMQAEIERQRAEAETEEERAKRLAEESKNLAFKYFGDVQAARIAIAAGQIENAQSILNQSEPSRRSVEWHLLNLQCRRLDSNKQLRFPSDEIDSVRRRFILSVHFPSGIRSELDAKRLATSTKVISIDQANFRWVYCEALIDLVASSVPFPIAGLPQVGTINFTAANLRLDTTARSIPEVNCMANQAWISPNGQLLVCLQPEVVAREVERPTKRFEVDITLKLKAYSLDGEEIIAVDLVTGGEPIGNFQWSISPPSVTGVGNVTRAPHYQAAVAGSFNEDSSEFFLALADKEDVYCWNLEGLSERESPRTPVSKLRLEQASANRELTSMDMLIRNDKLLLAASQLVEIDLKTKTQKMFPLSTQIRPQVRRFSSSGRTLALMGQPNTATGQTTTGATIPSAPVPKPTGSSVALEFQFMNLETMAVEPKIAITNDQYRKQKLEAQAWSTPAQRSQLVANNIYTMDHLHEQVVDDSVNRWTSVKLKDGTQFFFEKNSEQPFVAKRIAQDKRYREREVTSHPRFMRLAQDEPRLVLGYDNHIQIFAHDGSSANWKPMFDLPVPEDNPILDATWDPREYVLLLGQRSGVSVLDLSTRKVTTQFAVGPARGLHVPRVSRIAFTNAQGDVQILNSLDGTILKHFNLQRDGHCILAHDPKSNLLAAGGIDRRLSVWSTQTETEVATKVVDTPVANLTINSTCQTLTVTGIDNSISVFDLPTLNRRAWLAPTRNDILWTNTSNDGKRQFVVSHNGCKILDLEKQVEIMDWLQFSPPIRMATMNDKQTMLYVYTSEGFVECYSL